MKHARLKVLVVVLLAIAAEAPAFAATVQAGLLAPHARIAAPAFHLTDASGKVSSLGDYRGKVVVLNFWATECGGCRLEIPWFVQLAQDLKNKRAAIVGISMDISYEDLKNAKEAWAKVLPFVSASRISYPILMGDAAVSRSYAIEALPVTCLIDLEGRIAATYIGLIDKQNVQANVLSLLAEHR